LSTGAFIIFPLTATTKTSAEYASNIEVMTRCVLVSSSPHNLHFVGCTLILALSCRVVHLLFYTVTGKLISVAVKFEIVPVPGVFA
jgi:predicted secreted protein